MSDVGRRLVERVRRGAAPGEDALRKTLGVGGEADDREVARELVATIARGALSDLRVGEPEDARPAASTPVDGSFLGRLAARPGEDRPCIAELDDVPTLVAVLRGGSLQQRRAAALRFREMLERGDLDDARIGAIEQVLIGHRDPDVAFEVTRARAALPGEVGDEARDEDEPWAELVKKLEPEIARFWEGETTTEPIAELPGEQRAWIGLRARLLPDRVIAHLSAVLEGSDGASDLASRRALLESLRCAGDPRLLPALVSLLESRVPELVPDAARALARIDDPRARPALVAAHERSVVDLERAVLAGALALAGDARGLAYLRTLLRGDDPRVVLAAAEAMEWAATSEDVELLIRMLDRRDAALLGVLVRALGRIGDGRALRALEALRDREPPSALLADVEDAAAAIRAQMDLRGEEPPVPAEPSSLATAARAGVVARGAEETFWARLQGRFDLLLGRLWLAIGAVGRAIAWFELAAARRPRWPEPLAAIALAHVRQGEPARALGAFRRAIEANRAWVEHERPVVRTLAGVVLRRAEEMERAGRLDIARGLLDEVLDLDLRRVPSNVRFELRRRREALASSASVEAA
ncbi:HEAT repeat domain-containing protein [Sandaracinus amylolyticus]|uniref:Uncharacterized protein n=1 Tax=Sandaracinus amylolyticus TaxID=927083 RepID=A0A0F6W423_9BACT|nr:HEAT repeat domain-containing protein [Sandaracinus amylolyticus]AKF06962.1 hypothetical protein DB32_004111 [Sandaracinus amylolyticus]